MRKTVIGAALLIAGIAALILTGHLNILLAILMIGLVICFHELGHYLIARLNGVKVKEFSLGMGPTLVSWKAKKSGTRWSIKLLPFGGSCLMLGDDEALVETVGEGNSDDPDEVETPAEEQGDPDETNEDAVAASELTEEDREGPHPSRQRCVPQQECMAAHQHHFRRTVFQLYTGVFARMHHPRIDRL